jgi:hypothetical protein
LFYVTYFNVLLEGLRLKNAFYLVLDFRVSNHCWAFQSLLRLWKLPSNHSATVTTLLYAIIRIFIWLLIVKKKISTICLKKQVFQIWHNLFSELTSMWTFKIYSRNTKTTNKPTASNNKSDRLQVKIWDTWKTLQYLNINDSFHLKDLEISKY